MKPDFDRALQGHLDTIAKRDLAAFKANLTRGDTLYTIVQNGHAFTTPQELADIHEQWFRDPRGPSVAGAALARATHDGSLPFCARARRAGVQGYFAYPRGRRVVYSGRQGDEHVEWFPGARPKDA